MSIAKFRRAITPRRTVTDVGLMRSIRDVFVMRTEYDPAGSATRYRPVELVTTDRTARPSRTNVKRTPAAGAEHGWPS